MTTISPFLRFTERFANRVFLRRKAKLQFRVDRARPRLYCEEPAIVTRFAAQLTDLATKHLGPETKVLMRGQSDDHPGMVPGLFRPPATAIDTTLLLCAERLLEQRVRSRLEFGRFKRPDLAALLQHYGYRTSWLDVVDNPWVAVWFATHQIDGAGLARRAIPRREGTGWLYLIAAQANPQRCRVIDLRRVHHGFSLRPHTQSGWSVRGSDGFERDLNSSVIACIEFPVQERWVLWGHMGSGEFLFPPMKLDDTLRRLVDNDVDRIVADVEGELALPDLSLGRAYYVVT